MLIRSTRSTGTGIAQPLRWMKVQWCLFFFVFFHRRESLSGGGAQRIPEVTKENIHTIILFSIILEKKSRHSDGRWVMLKGGVSFNQSTVPREARRGEVVDQNGEGEG